MATAHTNTTPAVCCWPNRLEAAAAEDDLPVVTTVYQNGWPDDPTALDNADTVVVYCDGADQHFLHEQGEAFEGIMRRGVGLVCIHYRRGSTQRPFRPTIS